MRLLRLGFCRLRRPVSIPVRAQRKIPVDLHFLHHLHKAGGASLLGAAHAACFEELAGVFASSGASIEKTDDTLTKKRTILC
jgi:hypothetical protein